MSLQTLKKKSRNNRRFAPVSGRGKDGFSLNGGYRNIGSVGQFRLISNVTRTPYKGTTAKGNGGKLGTYYKTSNQGGGLNSGNCSANNNAIIKKSSINTAGMIDTKYKWMKGKYPNFWVQEDDNSYRIHRDQQTYIENLTKAVGQMNFTNIQTNGKCGTTLPQDNDVIGMSGNCSGGVACSYFIGTKKYIRTPYAKNYNQLPLSQGQYISTGGVSKNNCLPTRDNKKPFPMNLNHVTSRPRQQQISSTFSNTSTGGMSSCQQNFATWQEAQAAGLLPIDYDPGYSISPPDNYDELVQRSSNFPVPNIVPNVVNTRTIPIPNT